MAPKKKANAADEIAKIKKENSGIKRRVDALEKSLATVTERLNELQPLPPESEQPIGPPA